MSSGSRPLHVHSTSSYTTQIWAVSRTREQAMGIPITSRMREECQNKGQGPWLSTSSTPNPGGCSAMSFPSADATKKKCDRLPHGQTLAGIMVWNHCSTVHGRGCRSVVCRAVTIKLCSSFKQQREWETRERRRPDQTSLCSTLHLSQQRRDHPSCSQL